MKEHNMYIDVNVSYGPWPFQTFPVSTIAELKNHLANHGIQQALVSHLGTVFNPDTHAFNKQLFEEVQAHPEMIPVPVIQPALPGWERQLHACHEAVNLRAVKLLPGYHLYSLQSDEVQKLARQLIEWQLPLLVQMRIEDERSQYRGLTAGAVPSQDIIALNQAFPKLKLVCLNAQFNEAIAMAKETNDHLSFDISFTEHGNTVDALTKFISPERLLMGSHTPFLYTSSATLKIEHSTREEAVRKQIAQENARQLFGL